MPTASRKYVNVSWRTATILLVALTLPAQGCLWTRSDSKPTLPPLAATQKQSKKREQPAASNELPPKETAQACLATAEELERNGHFREAILLYEKARKNDPGMVNFSRRLAVLYDREGKAPQALAEYQKSLKAAPDDADLLNDLGFFQFRQGDHQAAEKTLRRALQHAPKHKRASMNLAVTLAWQNRYQESFETFARIVGPAAAHSNVGALMAKQGRTDEAMRAFRQSLAIDPSLEQPKALLSYLENQRTGELQADSKAGSPVKPASFNRR